MLESKLKSYGYNYSSKDLTLPQKISDIFSYLTASVGRTLMQSGKTIPHQYRNDITTKSVPLHGINTQGNPDMGTINLMQVTRGGLQRIYFDK